MMSSDSHIHVVQSVYLFHLKVRNPKSKQRFAGLRSVLFRLLFVLLLVGGVLCFLFEPGNASQFSMQLLHLPHSQSKRSDHSVTESTVPTTSNKCATYTEYVS
jgi:hypothetical protein